MTPRCRLRVHVRGVVQGVGFRPFVYTTAAALGLAGCVRNDSSGALIEVEGDAAAVDQFVAVLRDRPPPLAVLESIDTHPVPVEGGTEFTIADSSRTGGGRTLTSPDVAMCDDCAAEQQDPADRRYRHPFVNCTNCGPRFTIIGSLPYDRAATTMADFAMCADCEREYHDPGDRRFHAQPICCPNCGPTLTYRAGDGHTSKSESALQDSRRLLREGGVLAVKGVGGYHLACDAANESAVAELRRRKRRGDKPFAVMVADLQTARHIAEVDEVSAGMVCGPQRPIVLIPRKSGGPVAESVAPHNPDLGVMLAYAPLHTLLFGLAGDEPGPRVLVMTSGNLAGEPICFTDDEALERLSRLADGWLMHDRAILVPCDDSVMRVVTVGGADDSTRVGGADDSTRVGGADDSTRVGGADDPTRAVEVPIRRSRGYAPLPIALPVPVAPSLAVGGDLKNTMAVADGRYAWLSQHIGDMDDLATLCTFDSAQHHLQALTSVAPQVLIADAHPLYRSTGWANRHADGRSVRTVQHHHAHIAAVMAEHGYDGAQQVLGFAFDGTGYGTDGAIWGGEVLLANYKGFQRLTRLKYVPLAGGDISVMRPYRMALAHLWAAGIDWHSDLAPVAACPADERKALARQLETGFGCTPTSSMGRLFDAVSALAGVRQVVAYEAQAAIELEGLSRGIECGAGAYAFEIGDAEIDPGPVLADVVRPRLAGVPAAMIGARFHRAVADLVVDLAEAYGEEGQTVALSGGVFQNALLLELTLKGLRARGIPVLTHRAVPPNDGGIALGQLMVGNAG